jgi:hypothetical protein
VPSADESSNEEIAVRCLPEIDPQSEGSQKKKFQFVRRGDFEAESERGEGGRKKTSEVGPSALRVTAQS